MAEGLISLLMTAVFVALWLTSGGKDKVRLVLAALWGFALSATLGSYVMKGLTAILGMLGTLFGA